MSNIAVQGGSGGTGTVTLLAPSTSTDRTLTLPDNTGTVVSTASSAVVTPAMLDTQAQYTGFKNRFINGAMVIDQRNAGAEVNPAVTGTYYLDRWIASSTVAGKYKIGQNAGAVSPPVGFVNYLGCTSLSAYTAGASEAFNIQQRIEGYNIADLAWGTASAAAVTISFWVYSSLTGVFGGSLRNSATNRSYPFTFTINTASTWELKTITIAGDTTGTWLTNSGIGMFVAFSLGAGSTLSGTAGAWAATNYPSATGATSVVGTSGATFYITGVQLEKGSTATSFDYRPYGTELALCQRYFEIGTAYGEGYQTINAPIGIGAKFAVTKRATPTTTYPSFTNGTNARAGADRSIFVNGYARYCLANATGALYAYETFTASAEL